MKTLNILRGITKITSRALAIIYGIFVSVVLIARAYTQAAPTADDVALFTLFGILVCTFFVIDYLVNVLRTAVRRQMRRSDV